MLIHFGRDDADSEWLLDGWSDIQDGGRFVFGPEARLTVLRPMTDTDLTLTLSVALGASTTQRLVIIADGAVVHECQITEPCDVTCRIPAERRFAHDTLALTLLLPRRHDQPRVPVTAQPRRHCT